MIRNTLQNAQSRVVRAFRSSFDPSLGQVRALALSLMLVASLVGGGVVLATQPLSDDQDGVAAAQTSDDWTASLPGTVIDVIYIEEHDLVVAIHDDGSGTAGADDELHAYDAATGSKEWTATLNGNADPADAIDPIAYDPVSDAIITVSDSGVESLDVTDGSTIATRSISVDNAVVVDQDTGAAYVYERDTTTHYKLESGSLNTTATRTGQANDLESFSGGFSQASDTLFLTTGVPTTSVRQLEAHSSDLSSFSDSSWEDSKSDTAVADGHNSVYTEGPNNTLIRVAQSDLSIQWENYANDGSNRATIKYHPGTQDVWYSGNTTYGLMAINKDGSIAYNNSNIQTDDFAIDEPRNRIYWVDSSTNELKVLADPKMPDEPPEPLTGEEDLELDVERWMLHGETQNYTVIYTDQNGTRQEVTSNATVTSNNTSVITVDTPNTQLAATSDTSINGTGEITAEYNGKEVTETVTVANATLDNAQILPGTVRVTTMIQDDTIFLLLIVAMIAGIIGRYAGAFAGLGMGQLAVAIGWFGGYIGNGSAMISVFLALFIGFNMAANIDYSVRR